MDVSDIVIESIEIRTHIQTAATTTATTTTATRLTKTTATTATQEQQFPRWQQPGQTHKQ